MNTSSHDLPRHDKPEQAKQTAASSAFHSQLFQDPTDYLDTLRLSFSTLSRGQDNLTLNDLQIDSKDASLGAKVQSAAAVAAAHYDDLMKLAKQSDPSHQSEKGLTYGNIDSLDDTVSGYTVGASYGTPSDTTVMALFGAETAFGAAVSVGMIASGLIVPGVLVAAATAAPASEVVEAAMNFAKTNRLRKEEVNDGNMVGSWIK